MLIVTLIALILAGGGLCLLLVRLVGGSRALLGLLLTSYALRVALALGFYLVSAYELPLFRALQLPDGFWRFSYDAPSYHVNGARIAEALRLGTELPQVMVGNHPFIVDNYDFFYLVGLVYWAFGAHPLYVPLLNSMLWTATASVGYVLARRMKGENAGVVAAALISLWPSSYIWSSQILKEGLTIFLLLFALQLVIQFWETRRWSVLAAALVLVPGVFLLTRLRFYLVALLMLAVVLSVVLALAVRFREFRWERVGRALTLMILLWVPFLSARYVDPFRLLYMGELDILGNEINEILEAKPEESRMPAGPPQEAKGGPAPPVALQEAKAKLAKGPTPVVPLQEAKAKPAKGPTPAAPPREAKPETGPTPAAPPREAKPETGPTPVVPLQEAKAKPAKGPTPVVPLQEAKAKPEQGPTPVTTLPERKPEKAPTPAAPPREAKPETGQTPPVALQEAKAKPAKGPTPVVPLQEAKAKPEGGPTPAAPPREAKAKPEQGPTPVTTLPERKPEKAPTPAAPPREAKPETGPTPVVPLQEAKAKPEKGPTPVVPLQEAKAKPEERLTTTVSPQEVKSEKGPTPAAIPLKIKPARNLARLLDPYRLPKVMKLVGQRMIPWSVHLAHQTYGIETFETRRMGYAIAGGASSFATDVQFRNAWETAVSVPRSLAYAFYAPFPWEWFSPGGDTGAFKSLAGIETVLMIALTPFLLLGILRAARSRRADTWMILIFGVITIVALAMTVTNLGTLFRLRLEPLTSFFIVAAAYGINAETLRRPIILRNFFR